MKTAAATMYEARSSAGDDDPPGRINPSYNIEHVFLRVKLIIRAWDFKPLKTSKYTQIYVLKINQICPKIIHKRYLMYSNKKF